MNIWLKISLYVVFGALASIFGFQAVDAFKKSSESGKAPSALRMELEDESNQINSLPPVSGESETVSDAARADSSDVDPSETGAEGEELANVEAESEQIPSSTDDSTDESESKGMGIGTKAGIFFLSLVALALLIARDITEWFANRAVKTLSNDEDELATDDTYEQAEQLWANGEPIQAVEMFRVYLKKYPNQVHASFRIAEIYEKDLNNFLAAALEYEELLEKKLSRDRWGWAAIHLCNLYSGKLNQPDKALNLLRKVSAEYSDTPAGEKATARLKQIEG